MPYNKVKNDNVFKIKLDGQDYVVELGKHFTKLAWFVSMNNKLIILKIIR